MNKPAWSRPEHAIHQRQKMEKEEREKLKSPNALIQNWGTQTQNILEQKVVAHTLVFR